MKKLRIVLADEEETYLAPLRQRVVEELFGRVDLETYSEGTLLSALFSEPQEIDVLVVSEPLYHALLADTLPRHHIRIVVITQERDEPDRQNQDPEGVYRVFRYSGARDLFQTIGSRILGLLEGAGGQRNRARILAVTSACGGAGKTTVALELCAALTGRLRKTLYIGASHLQTFQRFFGDSTPISCLGHELRGNPQTVWREARGHVRQEGFSYLPPFCAALPSIGLEYSIFRTLAEGARDSGEYDYIVVDTESVFCEEQAKLLAAADRVILVTGESAAAQYAMDILLNNLCVDDDEKYLFVLNRTTPALRSGNSGGREDPGVPGGGKSDSDALKIGESDGIGIIGTDQEREICAVSDYIPRWDTMRCGDFAECAGIRRLVQRLL